MSDKNVPPVEELFPPEGDPEVGKKVFQVLEIVVKDKVNLGLHKRWNRNYQMFDGEHWRNKTTIPLVDANLVFRHVQQTKNQLTDNDPTFNINKGEGDQKVYQDLQRAATYWWGDQEQQDSLEISVQNGEIYGICIEKVIFNPELEYGLGEAETVNVDPFHFGWYPTKLTNIRNLQKSEALFHYYPMTVREARRRWPGIEIKGDSSILKEMEDERRNVNSLVDTKPKSMMVSLASVAKEILNWGTAENEEEEELCIVETWVHDYTMVKRIEETVQESVTTEEGEIPTVITRVEITEPMYPGNIRYIVACNGKTVLEDRPNPNVNPNLPEEDARKTYLYDKFPFAAANSVRDTSNAWGMSDIKQLEKINMEMNKSLSQLVLEKDRAVRRKWINPINSGVPNDHFTNFTSVLNPVDDKVGAGIRVVEYPAPPMDIQNTITMFKEIFFLISATFEVDQAQMGSNQLAYKSIAALIERVATMMRGKIRSYSRLIRERGRMYISHVQNFYTEDRWITYEDEKGVEKTGVINGNKMIIPAKLTVVTGSTLPTSRVQQREESITLYQANAIDRQELLSAMDWPGRADVIERMNQGVIGSAVNNLQMLGFPPQLLQYLAQVESMDPEKLKKAAKAGEIPVWQQLLQALVSQAMNAPPAQPTITPVEQAEVAVKNAEAILKQAESALKQAETQKVTAETNLTLEKINTEKVNQGVKTAGVGFDAEKIKMDKAKTVSELTSKVRESKGAKQPERPKVVTPTPGSTSTTIPPPPIVQSVTDKPAGFNESGMKSNNTGE